jgi:glycosyltransferase involved in cell wall biosynthesis
VRPWQVAVRRPRTEAVDYLGFPGVAVGAYVPELEWCRYLPHGHWRRLIAEHDACVGVLGSVLPAVVFALSDQPALCWVGTPYLADRDDRARSFSASRRVLDRVLERPISERLERLTLRCVDVLSISPYTQAALREIEPLARSAGVLLPPIDVDVFHPGERPTNAPFRIGFVGRVEDPRKNIELLVAATGELRRRRLPVETHIFGGEAPSAMRRLLSMQGLAEAVTFHARGDMQALVAFYRSLDIFVIPSHQEGLAVVGLEAMACGLPVVSTRCGGPAAYVREGETGLFAGFDAVDMADRIQSLLEDASLRRGLGRAAEAYVRENNSPGIFRDRVAQHLSLWFSLHG